MTVMTFVIAHKALICTLLMSGIGLVKLTAWGRANARALEAVAQAVEDVEAKDVKLVVWESEARLPAAARDALHDAIAAVSADGRPRTFVHTFVRELFRGLRPSPDART